MNPEFWHHKWDTGAIGFHEGKPNRFLLEFGALLGGQGRVLVPLCGKAVDMLHLAELGHQVVGSELSARAAEQFFTEHALPFTRAAAGPSGRFERFAGGPYEIWVGDFFALTPAETGAISALYDRAAIIALPPNMRAEYAAQAKRLAPRAPALVVTVEYLTSKSGPPFSVSADDLARVYGAFNVRELAREATDSPGALAKDPSALTCAYEVKL